MVGEVKCFFSLREKKNLSGKWKKSRSKIFFFTSPTQKFFCFTSLTIFLLSLPKNYYFLEKIFLGGNWKKVGKVKEKNSFWYGKWKKISQWEKWIFFPSLTFFTFSKNFVDKVDSFLLPKNYYFFVWEVKKKLENWKKNLVESDYLCNF